MKIEVGNRKAVLDRRSSYRTPKFELRMIYENDDTEEGYVGQVTAEITANIIDKAGLEGSSPSNLNEITKKMVQAIVNYLIDDQDGLEPEHVDRIGIMEKKSAYTHAMDRVETENDEGEVVTRYSNVWEEA